MTQEVFKAGSGTCNRTSQIRCNVVLTGQLLGEVELDAILVLHHPHRDLEEFHDTQGRMGFSEFGMDQDFSAQRLGQHVGDAGKEHAQVIGEETVV